MSSSRISRLNNEQFVARNERQQFADSLLAHARAERDPKRAQTLTRKAERYLVCDLRDFFLVGGEDRVSGYYEVQHCRCRHCHNEDVRIAHPARGKKWLADFEEFYRLHSKPDTYTELVATSAEILAPEDSRRLFHKVKDALRHLTPDDVGFRIHAPLTEQEALTRLQIKAVFTGEVDLTKLRLPSVVNVRPITELGNSIVWMAALEVPKNPILRAYYEYLSTGSRFDAACGGLYGLRKQAGDKPNANIEIPEVDPSSPELTSEVHPVNQAGDAYASDGVYNSQIHEITDLFPVIEDTMENQPPTPTPLSYTGNKSVISETFEYEILTHISRLSDFHLLNQRRPRVEEVSWEELTPPRTILRPVMVAA